MKLRVERQHIVEGMPCDSEACAIALALEEATGDRWSVGIIEGITTAESATQRLLLSKRAARFVDDFDEGRPVFPGVFILKEAVLPR